MGRVVPPSNDGVEQRRLILATRAPPCHHGGEGDAAYFGGDSTQLAPRNVRVCGGACTGEDAVFFFFFFFQFWRPRMIGGAEARTVAT